MDIMNDELYENMISLLKKALEFYGNKDKYVAGYEEMSTIEQDAGETARFALNKVNEITNNLTKFDDDFNELIKSAENREIDGNELLKNLNKLMDGNIGN